MRGIRRILQVLALVGTLLVGVIALALIASQTPWFKDWLRRYIVREAKQYLNGDLSIGRLGGNLFFGVELADVTVDVSGERLVAVKGVEVDYSVFQLISGGVVLDELKLVEPKLRLEREGKGWTIGKLVKEQRKEAEREGPARPIALNSIEIADGSLDIVEDGESKAYVLPQRIHDLDVRASFAYAPVHYSIGIDHVSLRGAGPDLDLKQLKGQVAVRDDNLYLENLVIQTSETSLTIDGVIEQYLRKPIVKIATTGKVSVPEIARVVPAARGYGLHPALDIKANGPADALVFDLNVQSEAGKVRGRVTADVEGPDLGLAGDVTVERLNLAPILKNPAQRSDITGTAKLDLDIAATPERAPIFDRLSGTFRFDGPKVVAAGYEAANVKATGKLTGGRIVLNASANAYGGTATASGFIRPPAQGRALALNLKGSADNVNLQKLPASLAVPALETKLSVAEYQIDLNGRTFTGSARLNQSTIEGATIGEGTVAEFGRRNGTITYAARGDVADLDLPRLGGALRINALNKPEYEGRITGTFDVRGAGTKLESMTLDASGMLGDASIMGATLKELAFETHLAGGALDAKVNGAFQGLDPSRAAQRPQLAGTVNGTVDASVKIADLTAPITPEALTANGRVSLIDSTIGELRIEKADIQGNYANRVGDISQFSITGPDGSATASGRFALDRNTQSNLKYRVEATDLAQLGRLAGQEGLDGSAIVEGTLTGNADVMQTTGTLDGSNLTYQDNNALDLLTKYDVSVPDLSFGTATIKATTTANFVKAGGLQLNLVEATTTFAEKTLDFDAQLKEEKRELEARGRVIFHPDHQEIHLPAFTIRTQGQVWSSRPGTEAAVQYGGRRLTMQNVRLVSNEQELGVDGTLSLDEADTAGELKVTATNVDLASVEQLLLQNRGFTGRLNANATISGSVKKPIVDGHAEIQNGGFQSYKYQSFTADVDYQGTRFEVDARLQQSPTEAITARGTVPTTLFRRSQVGHVAPTGEDQLDLRIQSTDLGLGIIQGFTTVVTNVRGTLQADIRLTGSGDDPHAEGHIDIKGGAFDVPLGGTGYAGLDTRIDLSTDLVRIQKFQITDLHNQPMTVSGQLAVHAREVGAVDINIQTDNFEILDNSLGDIGVDTELKVTGELRRPRIVGQVRIEAGRLEVDQLLQMFYDPYKTTAIEPVVSAERQVEGAGSAEQATKQALSRAQQSAAAPTAAEASEPAAEPAGAFAPVELDVRLLIPDNLVLRGTGLRPGGPNRAAIGDLNITVGGDVQIRKAADAPMTLTGVVNTVRGTYQFQGRRFDLVRDGTVRFTGESKLNPLLDVSATRDIPNTGVEARIHVTGSVEAPQLRLSSDPPLEESDVLALIVFNRPVNELGTGERGSLAATAGGIATGFLAAPLGESIGRALDVDLFEITTTTDTGELGAGITIGQQIGDRAFFKLRQQFGEENITEFLIEYQLADFLRLQLSGSPESSNSGNRIGQRRVERAGIDLFFFFSY
jgi:autotransporter translocation and assembly factor TamB